MRGREDGGRGREMVEGEGERRWRERVRDGGGRGREMMEGEGER